MHVLIFPARDKDGKDIVDVTRQDRFTLVLKADKDYPEAVCMWHTPFDALTPVPPCAKCGEQSSAKWSFCPWCGQKLPASGAASDATSAKEPAPPPPAEDKEVR